MKLTDKQFKLSYLGNVQESISMNQVISFLREHGVSTPPELVMIIDAMDVNHWIGRDYTYVLYRVK